MYGNKLIPGIEIYDNATYDTVTATLIGTSALLNSKAQATIKIVSKVNKSPYFLKVLDPEYILFFNTSFTWPLPPYTDDEQMTVYVEHTSLPPFLLFIKDKYIFTAGNPLNPPPGTTFQVKGSLTDLYLSQDFSFQVTVQRQADSPIEQAFEQVAL